MSRRSRSTREPAEPPPWWIECSEIRGIDQLLALASPSARHLVQLAPGRLRLRLFRLEGPGLELDGGWANLPLRAVGTTPPHGRLTVSFVLEAPGGCRMYTHPIEEGTALVWPAGLEYDGVAPAGHRWVTAIVPDVLTEALGGRAAVTARRNGEGLRCAPFTASMQRQVRRLLRAVRAWRAPEIADLDPAACRELRAEWHDLIGSVLRESHPAPPPSRADLHAHRIVRAVEDHLLANLDRRLRLADVCKAVDVPPRTVETAFHRVLGMPPVQYLETLRAHALYLELRRRGPHAPKTVQEAEARCGVFHPSRFAGRYRALFGEGPSETLEAARAEPAR